MLQVEEFTLERLRSWAVGFAWYALLFVAVGAVIAYTRLTDDGPNSASASPLRSLLLDCPVGFAETESRFWRPPPGWYRDKGILSLTRIRCEDRKDKFVNELEWLEFEDEASAVAYMREQRASHEANYSLRSGTGVKYGRQDWLPVSPADEFLRSDYRSDLTECIYGIKDIGKICDVQDHIQVRIDAIVLEVDGITRDGSPETKFEFAVVGDAHWDANERLTDAALNRFPAN